jgi:hypothetical protein
MGIRGRTNLTDENIFFVTTTIVGFTRVFVKEIYCKILVKNILHCNISIMKWFRDKSGRAVTTKKTHFY